MRRPRPSLGMSQLDKTKDFLRDVRRAERKPTNDHTEARVSAAEAKRERRAQRRVLLRERQA